MEKEKQTYTQSDVDLMLWQYAMGMLEQSNALIEAVSEMSKPMMIDETIKLMNRLISFRHDQLVEIFHIHPSFKIVYHADGTSFRMEKVKP